MAALRQGDIIAEKYRVERLLGAGGMGYVVAARHVTLDQLVAIKLLTKGALGGDGDQEAHARFRREAKAVVQLTGEHVARVLDVGLHEEEPFIVMEHLEGADLLALAKARGALSAAEASEYVLQVCEALAEAHALGIVHRDIKLANLFLTKSASGFPLIKVLDFGVSKLSGMSEVSDVTRASTMLGSPKYMSPEQMNDPRGVDARTDVWSAGVVLYRLVSGKAPFEGDTIGRLCTMVLYDPPPPLRQVRTDLPPGFEHVVDRCLEKDRAARFPNVAALAAALVPFCADPERARERADEVARVLGVPAVPSGLGALVALPSSPAGLRTMDAWASTGTRSVPPSASHTRVLVALAAAGLTLVGVALGYILVARSAPATAHATEVPLLAVEPPPVAQPPPPSLEGSVSSPSPITTATVSASPSASTTTSVAALPATPRRSPVRRPVVSAIPDDRK